MSISNPKRVDFAEQVPRWASLILGVLLILSELVIRWAPLGIDTDHWLAGAVFSKVGIMLIVVWLAWPALITIRRAPGGFAVLVASAFVFLLFLAKPRSVFLTGPFIAIAIGIALFRSWLTRTAK